MFFKTQKTDSGSLGQLGERIAQDYLKKSGYRIVETNFKNTTGRCLGEIDIIAKKEQALFFIEVKTRRGSSSKIILPEENINSQKLKRLAKIIQIYIKKKNLYDFPYQIDAISILIQPDSRKFNLRHLKNIFL